MRDAHKAYARALELGAQPVEMPTGPMELRLPAIKGIGGAPLYLIDRFEEGRAIYDIDFAFVDGVDRHPAGHGLTAGLIMLMVQSGTASLVRALPEARPSQLVTLLNDVVFANVNQRLGETEHVTYALLRYYEDGRIVHAGAHEDMVVYRQREKRCEVLRTNGMWLGALPGIEQMTTDSEFQLEAGDVLVLYSDGIIESLNAEHEMYGSERLVAKLIEVAAQPVAAICAAILDDVLAHTSVQDDDRTVVVLRQL